VLGRSLPDDSAVPFIQTDVPINPGNLVVLFNALRWWHQLADLQPQRRLPGRVVCHPDRSGHAGAAANCGDGGRASRLGVAVQEVNQSLPTSSSRKPEGAGVDGGKGGQLKTGLQAGDVIQRSTASPSSRQVTAS
jgi:serine protease Do